MTEWRPIPKWPEYEVSDDGGIRRRTSARGTRIGASLTTPISDRGYPIVRLTRDYKSYCKQVHRLVAEAFIGPCPVGKEVNHKDGNRLNPHIENLEYVTRAENILHCYRVGGRIQRNGETVPNAKLTNAQAIEIWRLRGSGLGVIELGRRFGISARVVGKIHSGQAWVRVIQEVAS